MKNKGLNIVIGIYIVLAIASIIPGFIYKFYPYICMFFFACSAYVIYVLKKHIEKQNEYYKILIFLNSNN